ncbi:hypothetical protein B0H34DRAFT_711804 [Crassisporium funariophilum]|nr:hypothetical protein B0H34DRAFT_711804 [Crassisporium funariophilum]
MPFYLQCSIDSQDCPALYDRLPPFTNQSCVKDVRLEGNVGRCGFAGAPCDVAPDGIDNCGFQAANLCNNGICGGGVGGSCNGGALSCNAGIFCNASAPDIGVCGGAGASVTSDDPGLDFARDYCLSGKAKQLADGSSQCLDGPPLILTTTSGSTSTSSITSTTGKTSSSASGAVGKPSPTPSDATGKPSSTGSAESIVGHLSSTGWKMRLVVFLLISGNLFIL